MGISRQFSAKLPRASPDELEQLLAVLVELLLADPAHREQLAGGLRAAGGDLLEGGVAEHHEGGDLLLGGPHRPPLPEPFEERLVVGSRRVGAAPAGLVGSAVEWATALEGHPRALALGPLGPRKRVMRQQRR